MVNPIHSFNQSIANYMKETKEPKVKEIPLTIVQLPLAHVTGNEYTRPSAIPYELPVLNIPIDTTSPYSIVIIQGVIRIKI
jgi:hypothetical protein